PRRAACRLTSAALPSPSPRLLAPSPHSLPALDSLLLPFLHPAPPRAVIDPPIHQRLRCPQGLPHGRIRTYDRTMTTALRSDAGAPAAVTRARSSGRPQRAAAESTAWPAFAPPVSLGSGPLGVAQA